MVRFCASLSLTRIVTVLSLLLASILCVAQPASSASAPALGKLSSKDLTACYDNRNLCGAHDISEISDELEKRLPTFSTDRLLACFRDWKICGVENDIASGWAVSKEVAHRGNPHKLLVQYWTDTDILVRDGIIHVAYQIKTPEVADFMRKVLAEHKSDEDTLYWSASYLAKTCDPEALKWLSNRRGRPEGCMLWAPTVALFGKCDYGPAIPYIVENSIYDACLNIDDEGVKDLRHFFPHSPRQFKNMEQMQDYFCSRAKQEGFVVHCNSK